MTCVTPRLVVWRRTAGVVISGLLLIAAGCGNDQDRESAGSAGQDVAEQVGADAVGIKAIADLSKVVTGRRPEVAVGSGGMIAYVGTDFGVGNPDTDLALSTDDGQSFQRLDFAPRLSDLGVVVGKDQALVIGNPCAKPDGSDPDAACAPAVSALAAYSIDLASGESRKLPEPPGVGFVKGSVGVVEGRSGVMVNVEAGPALLTWGGSGWKSYALPAETAQVCTSGDVLTAVTNGQSLTATAGDAPPPAPPAGVDPRLPKPAQTPPAIVPVPPGEPLWSAQVSGDGGRSWGAPVPFPAGETRDFGFTLGVLCGPRAVLVHTAQVAVFDPHVKTWTTVEMTEDAAVGPGTGGTWVNDDTVRMWPSAAVARPVEVGKGSPPLPETASTIEITGLLERRPIVKATSAGIEAGVTPSPLRGAGATQAGLVLLAGPTLELARAV